jgi:hypothetical protein
MCASRPAVFHRNSLFSRGAIARVSAGLLAGLLGSLPLVLPAGLLAPAGAQDHQVFNMSQSPANSIKSAVACAPGGAVLVAWEEEPGEIWTRELSGTLQDPVDHGAGHEPALCYRDGEFILAYSDGAYVRVRHLSDGGIWSPIQTLGSGGKQTARPDVAPAPAGAAAEAYLVWEASSVQVWFSQRVAGSWSNPEVVVDAAPVIGDAAPQVAPVRVADNVVPRVYYYDYLARLRYRERIDSTWNGWKGIPGPNFALDMDVAWDDQLRQHLVSTEPNHACPCNHLYYTHELSEGDWPDEVEVLDVILDVYNWPQYPSIAVDAEGVPRVFWYQIFHDNDQLVTGEQLFYFTRTGGVWTDGSEVLDGALGFWCGLATDPQDRPVFVWSQEGSRARDVLLSRYVTSAGVADGPVTPRFTLTVSPSPSGASAGLRILADAGSLGPRDGVVELYDALGRCVWSNGIDLRSAGGAELRWDGRDAQGRRLPRGVYQARVTAAGTLATARIVRVD